ncbi:MAG: TM1802 family CRISPR-associated protein, partial [Thermodesulfobacteriota bacterium]
MIQAVKEIGDAILERDNKTPLSTLIQDPKAEKVVALVFKKTEEDFNFLEVKLEEFDAAKIEKYIYRKGSSRGTDITPTSKVTNLEKTFHIKTKSWFEKIDLDKIDADEHGKSLIEDLKKALFANEQNIVNELKNFENESNLLITLKVNQNGEEKYLGEYEVFKKFLLQSVIKKDSKVTGINKVCSLCSEIKSSV